MLHVGASTRLKQWDAERWSALAAMLAARGFEPVWSAGRGEEAIVRACDPGARHRSYAGGLDLPQLWRLVADAALLVAPDTGVAHLATDTEAAAIELAPTPAANFCPCSSACASGTAGNVGLIIAPLSPMALPK